MRERHEILHRCELLVMIVLQLLLARHAGAQAAAAGTTAPADAASLTEPAQSLAGTWAFDLDPHNQGLDQKWFAGHTFADTIPLPGTTDLAGKGPATEGSFPGSLTRVHAYYGPAWYQVNFTVDPSLTGRPVDLFLERVLWQSQCWIDGRPAGTADSLDTPHTHELGVLAPGKHTLTLRISNGMIHPIGIDSHSFTEQTQTIWNGAIGKIELRPHTALGLIRAFPDAQHHSVAVEINFTRPVAGSLGLSLWDKATNQPVVMSRLDVPRPQQPALTPFISTTLNLPAAPKPWDEFSPNLYELRAVLTEGATVENAAVPVGFRDISRAGQHLAINGRPIFIRGSMDHSVFPLTGHPPMDVQGWKKVFAVYKSYGMNQMRCHSWTPPPAAFEAADEMGIYIQAEIFWMQYKLGSGKPMGKMKALPNMPGDFSFSDQSPDEFVHAELRRISDTYGNHPSLMFVVIGNELGASDWPVTGKWIADEKARDPRHWYAASTARQITPADDFSDTHAVPGIGWVRDRLEAFNDWDYEKLYAKAPVPIIAHELGQWPTYPRWSEIDKFTGVVRARDLQQCEALAKKYGVVAQDEAFHNASGALAIQLYKDEMESHLRTPSCTGFSTLCMQDYPGQGEALVGWVDSFLDSKQIVTPERFRHWCNCTVPLARLPKYVFKNSESITGNISVAHYGPAALTDAVASWRLIDLNGTVLQHGSFAAQTIPTGTVPDLGALNIPLQQIQRPASLVLAVDLNSGAEVFHNDWNIWVVPDEATAPAADVVITSSLDDARAALSTGKKVLLLAYKLGGKRNKLLAAFKPVYWSQWYFPWSETLGACVDASHPAVAEFPTADHYDWQWADLCKSGHGFVIDSLPADLKPIVQPVPDFHLNHRYATLFEAAVGPGKLMVCGYDLENHLPDRPAANQLRKSLLDHMQRADFQPKTALTDAQLVGIFPVVRDLNSTPPARLEQAMMHVLAGSGANGDQQWSRDRDEHRRTSPGDDYTIACTSVQQAGEVTAWRGENISIALTMPDPVACQWYVHLLDPDRRGRLGTVQFAGNNYAIPSHTGAGYWLKLDIAPADFQGHTVELKARTDSGPDLCIDQFAVMGK